MSYMMVFVGVHEEASEAVDVIQNTSLIYWVIWREAPSHLGNQQPFFCLVTDFLFYVQDYAQAKWNSVRHAHSKMLVTKRIQKLQVNFLFLFQHSRLVNIMFCKEPLPKRLDRMNFT